VTLLQQGAEPQGITAQMDWVLRNPAICKFTMRLGTARV
jgi:hypothetical protein